METKHAKVVILCGGRGVRFHEATEATPKPLIEIGEKPILWHIMKTYAHYGYKDFVLCLGYKGDVIKKYFIDYQLAASDFTIELGNNARTKFHTRPEEQGWKITLVETGLNAMTGARIKRAEKYIDSDIFMLTYGDAVSDVNIQKLVEFHQAHGKIGTVTAVHPLSRFGELRVEKSKCNTVREFREKAVIHGDYINGGFFVFDQRLFDYINSRDDCVFEGKPLEQLAGDRQLAAYLHNGYWQCMDTYRDWQALNKDWESDRPPWKVW
ncbi:MAG: glucose-1-phosphate cytidylyltransferase [Dehalococcoidales bacterium]|nr:glucose-1-phosphate cytidylyltransferase [Dehalococcoidales bacterium]